MTLYQYNSDNITTNANRINSSNYEPLFGDEESSRFVQPTGVSRVQEVTQSITRPANSDGFYLGIRDEGTCGSISRLIVFYVVCPTRVDGLVTYPESADILFEALCASNAHNITSLQVIAFSSNGGNCSPVAPGGAVCECDGGYVLSSDGLSCEGIQMSMPGIPDVCFGSFKACMMKTRSRDCSKRGRGGAGGGSKLRINGYSHNYVFKK